MSRLLMDLLGESRPLPELRLDLLEHASGNVGVDVHLTAEVLSSAALKMRALGLDPADTTGKELYHALYELVGRHDLFLRRRLGIADNADGDVILQHIRRTIETMHIPKTVWVMKHSAAKRLLKQVPPKVVMKQLHYRSTDSLLKREDVGKIVAVARLVESTSWHKKFYSLYKKLAPHDFELRSAEIITFESKEWEQIKTSSTEHQTNSLLAVNELGVIALLPVAAMHGPGFVLALLALTLHQINELRSYSAYFKLHQVRKDFGSILHTTLTDEPLGHAKVAGQDIHWRVLHRHYGSREQSRPDTFDPHLTARDIELRTVEHTLYHLEPALQFWEGLDFVGAVRGNEIVSMSLMDVVSSQVNSLSYEHRSVGYMRQALRAELLGRYIGQPSIERRVLSQLDTRMNEIEFLADNA